MNQGVEGGDLISEVWDSLQGKMYPTPLPSRNYSDSNQGIADNNGRSTRLYQVWQGRNTFFLGGRLVFGPDVKPLFLTLMLILVPVIMFCASVARELFDVFPHHLGRIILVVCIVWTTYVVLLLFITSGKDPGIVPRQPHPPDDFDGSTISADWASIQSGALGLPVTKDVVVNHKVVKVKYCRTCMFYRPPRCSHCSICNNCVERFDHHCPWVGQCIGRRNYRYFFMFVSSTTLLCLYVFAFCWVNIVIIERTNDCNIWRATLKSPISGILIAYTFLVAWFVGGLTTFHVYLICTNQTTYENFRYHYGRKSNPYNIGCAKNVWEALFSKIPYSKQNFRAHVIITSYSISNRSSYSKQSVFEDIPNTNFDLEVGKRQSVNLDDIEDTRTYRASGRLGRCETRSRNNSWDRQSDEWEITSDKNSEVTSDKNSEVTSEKNPEVTSNINILPIESGL